MGSLNSKLSSYQILGSSKLVEYQEFDLRCGR